MKCSAELLARWLALDDRDRLADELRTTDAALSLPQANQLRARLAALGPPAATVRLGIVHTYTSDPLDPWLHFAAAVERLEVLTYHAPYGFVQQAAEPGSGLLAHDPDLTLLLLQREDLHPSLGLPLHGLDAPARADLQGAVLEHLCALLGRFRERVPGQLLLTLLPTPYPPGLGLIDAQADRSEQHWWEALRHALAARLRADFSAVLLLDLDAALADLGRGGWFDPRFWYSARYPFTPAAAGDLARRVMAVAAARQRPPAKVLVLDADNTLWGGIVGEDGPGGIALGPDYPGNCYVAFQRRLLDYQGRGLLLALCSKNNPADVEAVLREHPHQLLRPVQFAAQRVNWSPKPQNLRELAAELNLGLEAFVFVDDSAHECAAVRRELPSVTVVQVPAQPVRVPTCLDRVARLETLVLTDEDRARTALYAQERQRRALAAAVGDGGGGLADYLRSLDMRMTIVLDDRAQVARITQLVNKTNQFNLTTRRCDEAAVAARMADPRWLVAGFSLADQFGDSGLVGVAMFDCTDPATAVLDGFLLSCRVIGRRAESAFLEALLGVLVARGVRRVVADYLPTAKNMLVKDFLPEHGFTPSPDGRFRRDLTAAPPAAADAFPIAVRLADGAAG